MNISAKICAAFFTSLVLLASASRADAFKIYAVDSANKLLSFDSASPGTILATIQITGLQAGETIEGIDFSPGGGQLYALGKTGSAGRIYLLNTSTGTANVLPSAGP